MIQHTFGLLFKPGQQWQTIAGLSSKSQHILVLYPFIFALLPATAWYWGTSQVGWTVGAYGETIKLTPASALQVNILFYGAMVGAVCAIGYFIHWMSSTYGAAHSSIAKGIMIAGLTATPLFVTGLVGFYPVLWIDLLIGVIAVSWAVYLSAGFCFPAPFWPFLWSSWSASWSCRCWPGTTAPPRRLPMAESAQGLSCAQRAQAQALKPLTARATQEHTGI